MSGYRLTFGTLHVNAHTVDDTAVAAMDVLGGVVGTLAGLADEVLSHDYLISTGAAQFIIRFEAQGDAEAYAAAKVALDSCPAPYDAVKLDRRSRRYVPVEV